jgi:hypothetical protein
MGKKKINVADLIFKIGDDGTLKIFEGQTKKAGKAVDKLGRSEATLNRNFKGASRQSSNQTKNFSKMAQGITGGLVPAYATLAANIFAIGAAFRFLQSASDLRILEQGQAEYATRTGASLSIMTRQLQAATDGQLAFAEAAQSVAIGTAAGLSAKQINELGVVAKNASLMLGRDLTDSFNRLVRGAVKAEPELLDELGIILRLETAAENYANKLDLNAKQLNIFQKSQSVVNEVLAQGVEKFGGVETQTNSLTKLAKSFDDLVNSIKRAIGPTAEFMATVLSKNTIATSGMGILAGSSLLRAVTPELKAIDAGPQVAASRAGMQGMLTDKGMKKFGALDSPESIKQFEVAMSRKSSSFLNYSKFVQFEAKRMTSVLKIQGLQSQLDSAGMFKRMGLNWKIEMELMVAEHGKAMGRIKMAQRSAIRFISFLGYAGLAISLGAMLAQFLDKSSDAEKAYEAAMESFGRLYEQNAADLEKTINGLVVHDALMTNMLQTARALNNVDFSNIMAAFNEGPVQKGFFSTLLSRMNPLNSFTQTGSDGGLHVQGKEKLSAGQEQGLEGLKRILQAEQKLLIQSGSAYKEHASIIKMVDDVLLDNKNGVIETSGSFKILTTELERVAEKGTITQNTMKGLGQTTQILTSSTTDFSKALRSFKAPQTQLTRLTSNIRQAGGALVGLGGQYETGEVDVKYNSKTGSIFDTATTSMLDTFLPSEGEIKTKMLLANDAISGLTQQIESGDYSGSILDGLKKERAIEAGKIVKEVGEATVAEAERLHGIEMNMIKDKTKVQTNLALLQVGATKGQAKELKMQGARAQNILNQTNQQTLLDELKKKGLTMDSAQVQMEQGKLDLMIAQGIQLEKNLDKQYQIEQAMKNSLESGLAGTFDDLMTGKNSSLSEGLANVAKGVFESVSKQLSEQMATGVSNFLFGNKELQGYQKGAEIIKQAHVDGIQKGMGYQTGDIALGSDQDSGGWKFLKTIGSFFGFAKGGITPAYAAGGGVFSGSKQGYPAIMHGNEAVVPLPDGKSIPVSGGMGGNVNVSINMTTGESSTTSDGADMVAMGQSIAQAVQNEIEKQQRPGGQLSPY